MRLFGKLGRRLLGWFLFVALIPLLFTGYQGYRSAQRAVEREVFLHMEAIAQSKSRAIDQWFSERIADVRVLSAGLALVLEDPARRHEIEEFLRVFQQQSQAYARICLFNPAGNVLTCTAGTMPATSAEETALIRQALASLRPAMGPIHLDPSVGPSMHLARAVRDEGGRPHGVVIATLALARTLNPIILDTTGLGHTGQAYLVDRGKVMLTPSRFMDHPDPLTHTMDSEGIRRALGGSGGAGVYEGFEGQPVLGAWAYLPEQQWALIAEMNADEAFAPLARVRRDALVVALITFAAIVFVVAFITRSIVLPVRELADASLDVSQGNLNRTVVVKLHDELGDLAARFNLMVQSLRESYEQLVRAQKQIVQSERLAAIGELVASVVHEIRNPLSAIKMNLRILENKCATDPVTAEHFRLARTQTERLESMLSELLDYSKPVALRPQPVPIDQLVQEAVRDFQGDGQVQNLAVEVAIPETLPPVAVDPERMTQVLLNLLLNARQAMPEGGTIRIAAEPDQANGNPAMRLTVTDAGQGISEENLKHVFEPFFTTRKQGTGLGLPNARKVVEAHGGTITVTSTPGAGTEIQVLLPA